MKDNYKRALFELSQELGATKQEIERMYRKYWRANKKYLESLPLKEDVTLDEEAFKAMKPGLVVSSLGTIKCTYKTYLRKKKRYAKDKEDKTVVQPCVDNDEPLRE